MSHDNLADADYYIPLDESTLTPFEQGVEEQAPEALDESLHLPLGAKLVMLHMCCERFALYGVRTMMPLYLVQGLGMDSFAAVAFVSFYTVAMYALPVVGGILSDSQWGPLKTICVFNTICLCGFAGLVAVAGVEGCPAGWAYASLFVIAIGAGGSKPCVSALGGDQLGEDAPEALQMTYWSSFYWVTNVGGLTSVLLTPQIRFWFGFQTAFAVCGGALLVALLIIVCSRAFLLQVTPGGSMVARAVRLIQDARLAASESTARKRTLSGFAGLVEEDEDVAGANAGSGHWLDAAVLFGHKQSDVDDVKSVLRLTPIFCGLPIFWSLNFQQGSLWLLQAAQCDLNLNVFGAADEPFVIHAAQTSALNTMLVLALLPLFDNCIYPALTKCSVNLQPLNRMTVGMVFASVAFLLTAWLQSEIDLNPVQEITNMTRDGSMHTEPVREGTRPQGGVSIYYQIPQFAAMACGEILASPSSLQFAYSAAPPAFKSVVIAFYYATVMVGNLLAGILYTVASNLGRVEMALLFAGLMAANAMIFLCIRCSYLKADLARQSVGERWPSLQPKRSELEFRQSRALTAV